MENSSMSLSKPNHYFQTKFNLKSLTLEEMVLVKKGTEYLKQFHDSTFDWEPGNNYLFIYDLKNMENGINKPLGFIIYYLFHNNTKIFISKIFIEAKYRRNKLGRQLIDHLRESYPNLPIQSGVDIKNKKSYKFFNSIPNCNPVVTIFELEKLEEKK